MKELGGKKYTASGTDIDEVKRLNAQSGLSYNQVKQLLADRAQGKGSNSNS
ncbi:MAG: hypothetical protein ACQEUT_19820 [Bacillota bacterium]